MLRIGPAGNCDWFYASGNKSTLDAPKWLNSIGLTAYEYSFGRGINMSDSTAESVGVQAEKYDVKVSVHAPYYINFANPDPEMIRKSIGYVINSAKKAKLMGGNRTVFHPASCGKTDRKEAFETTLKNFRLLSEKLSEQPLDDCIFCPETMGKLNQIGRVEEVLSLCETDSRFYPCFDFGHINSYSFGGLKTDSDYRRIIDLALERLGERASSMHIHFSKIEYGNSGEIRHLTFADEIFGPPYEPLAKIIDEYKMTPVIICESQGTMAEDALAMKKCHNG